MPLSVADQGKNYQIKRIGGKLDIKRHLENLGFITGENISIISSNNGNIIVNIKDSRLALNKNMAQKIYVG